MIYNYILHEKAQQEYEDAILWYLERSQKAAENFVVAFNNAVTLICEHPSRWRNQYKHYHELGLKKYPYTVIYTVEKDEQIVFIVAVYHQKRNPKKKYRK